MSKEPLYPHVPKKRKVLYPSGSSEFIVEVIETGDKDWLKPGVHLRNPLPKDIEDAKQDAINKGFHTVWVHRIEEEGGWASYFEAIRKAKEWALANRAKSVYAAAAYTYLMAIPMAKREAVAMGQSEEEGERVQLLYVISNLSFWRGPVAKASKEAIKRRIKALGG